MIPEFKASLVHRTSSKLARAIQKTVSGKKKKGKGGRKKSVRRILKQTGEKIKHYETLFLHYYYYYFNNNFVSGRQTGTLKQKLKR